MRPHDTKEGAMEGDIEVTVKGLEERVVAFVSYKGPYSQMPQAMGELFGFIGAQGLAPQGPPEGAYLTDPSQVPEEEALWELRCPVAAAAPEEEPEGRIGLKRLPAHHVASTMHRGPYEGIGSTYGAVMAWIGQHGYQVAGPPGEVYLTDPQEVAPEELLTEVRIPVIKM
jgi:effector-binding domain-containing protein